MELKLLSKYFISSLDRLKEQEKNTLSLSKNAITLCQETLFKMYLAFKKTGFSTIEEEIDFFKTIKVIPLSNLIYHQQLVNIESYWPSIRVGRQKRFIKRNLNELQQFFHNHIDFGQYLEMDCTHLDKYYFTCESKEPKTILKTIISLEDPEFSCPKGMLLAQFKANGKLVNYLRKKELQLLNPSMENYAQRRKLKWTGLKIDLIELIYALKASGAIKSDAGIKEVAEACEDIFDINLGNYYRKFIELRNRKLIERTRFLDKLKSSLIQRIEDADD